MTSPAPRRALDPLRDRIRRFQFVIGLGFASLVVGAALQAAIALRISERLQDVDSVVARLLAYLLVTQLWVYAVLPLFCYGAARIIPLKPWSTAIGAAAVGELFFLALDFVTGDAGLTGAYGMQLLLRALSLVAGVFLSAWAVRKGRADSEAVHTRTRAKAEEKKDEYAEFLRESARLAERQPQAGTTDASSTGTAPSTTAPPSGAEASERTANDPGTGPGRSSSEG